MPILSVPYLFRLLPTRISRFFTTEKTVNKGRKPSPDNRLKSNIFKAFRTEACGLVLVRLPLVCFVHRLLGGDVCATCAAPVAPHGACRYPTPNKRNRCMGIDVQQTTRIEDAVATGNEEYLKALFDAVHTGILIIDPAAHRIIDVNPAAARMIGLSRDEIIGSVCHRFVCPSEEGQCPVTDLGHAVHQSKRVLRLADGRERSIIKTVVPSILNGERCLIESFVDISEQKRIRRKIEESEQRTRDLADSLPQIVFETDVVGKITFSNRRGLEIMRYTQEELGGGRLRILSEGSRDDMLRLERNLHETLPIGSEEAQKFYIRMQIEKGLKPPPYNP